MKKTILILASFLVILSCQKKESVIRYDWQTVDYSGNTTGVIYDKTEDELLNCTTCGSNNGSGTFSLTPCNYYKLIRDEKKTYLTAGNNKIDSTTETVAKFNARCFNLPLTPINTDTNCQIWLMKYRLVLKSKPSSLIYYNTPKLSKFCGDTLKSIYKGKSILVRINQDSSFYNDFITN